MSGESRHSFRKGATLQNLKMTQNNFGHVTTSNAENNQDDQVEFSLDATHGITAMVKRDIFTSPSMLKFMESTGVSLEDDEGPSEANNNAATPALEDPAAPLIPLAKLDVETLELFDSIINSDPRNSDPRNIESKKMDINSVENSTDQEPKAQQPTEKIKICINSVCKAHLPEIAKFCNTCGFQQLAKFCHSCGHEFSMNDKFCLECGTKRKI